ncbi:MAG: undecaprenyl-phosphate glucose phosphotransferase [Hyphomicrobiaceae bacterium]
MPNTQAANAQAAIAAPISLHVPRLADFRFADRSSLVSPAVLGWLVKAVEALVLIGIGLAIAHGYVDGQDLDATPLYWLAITATALTTVGVFQVFGLYKIQALTSPLRQLPRLVVGWTIALGILVMSVFFLKIGPEFSRVWLALWFAIGGGALVTDRLILALVTRSLIKKGRLTRRAVIYGGGEAAEQLIARLEADAESDIRICGVFDDRNEERSGHLVSGYPNLGRLADLITFGRKTRVDLVIMAMPLSAEERVNLVLRALAVLPVDIRLAAQQSSLRFCSRAYSFIGSSAMIDLADKPLDDWGSVVKWLFDKIVGSVALILLLPVLAAVAIAIKLDSRGPVLFRQKRYGFNNELIEVYKFRSMYTDKSDASAAKLVTRDDPRVTRVGRFIRKSSLDELPQLFNVMNGSLSLVGPRPHALQAKAAERLYDEVVDGYFARHKVKPGITGWAQINGWRGETDTAEKIQKRVEFDLYYINNWSVFLDAYILFKTPISLLTTKNAY